MIKPLSTSLWAPFLALSLAACAASETPPAASGGPLDPAVPPRRLAASIAFVDTTSALALSTDAASGIALVDFDDDGWADITVASRQGTRLFRGTGGGAFEDATPLLPELVEATCPVFADVDDDGDLDLLLVGDVHPPVLLLADPPHGFRVSVGAVPAVANVSSAAFADVDLDGDLDLFLAVGKGLAASGKAVVGGPNLLLQNDGGLFTDATDRFQVAGDPAVITFSGVFADFDQDGDPDLLAVNDIAADVYYQNQGGSGFKDLSGDWLELTLTARMGLSVADFNGDGRLDLFATDFDSADLLLARPGGGFSDGLAAAIADGGDPTFTMTGWGCAFADLDGDGDLDIIATAGYHPMGPNQPARLGGLYALEQTADGRLQDISGSAGPVFADFFDGRGLAIGDFDRDGDIDVALAAEAGQGYGQSTPLPTVMGLRVLRNDGARPRYNGFLSVELRQPAPNVFAVGATITVVAAGRHTSRVITAGESYRSAHALTAHFGLGEAAMAAVTVRWPGGAEETWEHVSGAVRLSPGQPAQAAPPRAGLGYLIGQCVGGCGVCTALCQHLTDCDQLAVADVATQADCVATCGTSPPPAASATCAQAAACVDLPACFESDEARP